MKQILTVFVLVLCASYSYAQTADDLLIKGIEYHDSGEYDKAIETYLEALEIEPKSDLINYEIALSYFSDGQNEKAIIYANKVIKLKSEHIVQAYVVKGSALDELGRTKESIKLFEKAIKKHKDSYLLYFNLALNYYQIYELDKAEENAIKAIEVNQYHASSHFMLASINSMNGNVVQALLASHYFLYLEPNSTRSPDVYEILMENFGGNVSKDTDNPNNINITLSPGNDSRFGAAELMISLFFLTNNSEENEEKTKDELFIENTQSIFKMLGEMEEEKSTDVWWGLYIPFFNDIAQSEHIETYCHYIQQSGNENAKIWVEENKERIEEFSIWLDQNY